MYEKFLNDKPSYCLSKKSCPFLLLGHMVNFHCRDPPFSEVKNVFYLRHCKNLLILTYAQLLDPSLSHHCVYTHPGHLINDRYVPQGNPDVPTRLCIARKCQRPKPELCKYFHLDYVLMNMCSM